LKLAPLIVTWNEPHSNAWRRWLRVNSLLTLALFLNLLGFAEMALLFGYGSTPVAPISAGLGFVFRFAFSAFHGTAVSSSSRTVYAVLLLYRRELILADAALGTLEIVR
jgi:hypothetical protein